MAKSKNQSGVGRQKSLDAGKTAANGGQHIRRGSSGNLSRKGSGVPPTPAPATHQVTAQEHAKGKRLKSFIVRTVSTLVLIGSFVVFIWAGHVPLMFMVLGIQFTMVRELFSLASTMDHKRYERHPKRRLLSFTMLQWYWFCVFAFFLYFRFIKNNLLVEVTSSAKLAHLFGWTLRHYALVAFALYVAGFIAFVLTLEKQYYSYQFKQFGWTHMILITIFVPSSFFVSNIFEGLIWFLLPTSLVIVNDIFAYLAGFFFGRTPLIKLSPKKTWEGFLGGFFATCAAAWLLAALLSRFSWMTCPRVDLTVYGPLRCKQSAIFEPQQYVLGDALRHLPPPLEAVGTGLLGALPEPWRAGAEGFSFTAMPMQVHALLLGIFASFAAPFGGFFASGFKRAFKIKDFGDSIPGHGGMTDRMDCQVVMAVLSYMYFNHFVDHDVLSVASALAWVIKMPDRAQLELFERLSVMLAGEDLVSDALSGQVQHEVGQALQRLIVH